MATDNETQKDALIVFGFNKPTLRRNLIVFILGLQFATITYLYKQNVKVQEERRIEQVDMYKAYIKELKEQMKPINITAKKIDLGAKKTDSLKTALLIKITPKHSK